MTVVIKILVLIALGAIVWNLFMGMRHLLRGGESRELLRSLTWRLALSIALFLALYLLHFTGLLQPHELSRTAAATTQAK